MLGDKLQRAGRGDLAHYDPERGLKTIAVTEAAEKHFARAKDVTQLKKAIRAKLEAQAEFVAWWDTQAQRVRRGGDRRSNNQKDRSVFLKSGRDGIPTQKVLDRWRKRVGTPEALDATELAALAQYKKILEFADDLNERLKASLSNEWYTPKRYLDAARQVLGAFDLDPASSATANKEVKAAKYYTAEINGLKKPWSGRVWCNPPYGGLSGTFAEKLVREFTGNAVTAAILLVNANSTDAQWFQPLWNYWLCFTNHRINFIAPNGEEVSGSTHGSVFVYFGADRRAFLEQFSEFGAIVERAR
jgi:ParB family chromosome partitioning protein